MAKSQELSEPDKIEHLAEVLYAGAVFGTASANSRELVPWSGAPEEAKNEVRAQATYLRDHWEEVSNLLV